MNIFSIFRKKKGEDSADAAKRVMDVHAQSQGKLLPPNLSVSFQCECGQWLSCNLNNFNSVGGAEVMCAHCGTVTFLPPEILDYTPTGSKTAILKQDWQQLIRIVKHGK